MVAMTAIRRAIVNTLISDSQLVRLLGGPFVYHRYVRQQARIPSLTYFDYTDHPHPRIPILNMAVQVDVWDRTLDEAEEKALRVTQLLDTYDAEAVGSTPFTVTTGEVNWVAMYLDTERDNLGDSGPDTARKTLFFRLQAFTVSN